MTQHPPSPSKPFISTSVLARLQNGQFVAQRRSQPSLAQLAETNTNRRDELSPLAVAKRCIPYEPKVFTDRREQVISLANALNSSQTTLVLVEGEEGTGTTSLARAVVELMGGGPEQVLWLDVEPTLSDHEMVSFLIGYLNRIAASVTKSHPTVDLETTESGEDAMAQLRQQLAALAEKPVLVVMDHLGGRVTDHGFWTSTLLQELLNFLLAVPSVKMMLVGEHLPTAEVAALGDRVFQLSLPSTTEAHFLWQNVAQRLNVTQWNEPPEESLGTLIIQQLGRDDQRLASLMACLRHSVGQDDLAQWTEAFKNSDPKGKKASVFPQALSGSSLQQHLKHSPLRPLIRRSLLPQQLLSVLALPPDQRPANPDDWVRHRYSLYDCGASVLIHHLPAGLVAKTHEFLSQQYLAQRKVATDQRVLPVANSVLVQEARYHEEQAQRFRLTAVQQKALHINPSPLELTQTHEAFLSQADLDDMARHQERLAPEVTTQQPLRNIHNSEALLVPSSSISASQPITVVTSSEVAQLQSIAPVQCISQHSSSVSEALQEKLQPVMTSITTAQMAFSQQSWEVSQAHLESALHQLKSLQQHSQQLEAAIHSRLAYIAAIHAQWESSHQHHHQAHQLAEAIPSSEESILGVWLNAQQSLTQLLWFTPKEATLLGQLITTLTHCEEAIASRAHTPEHGLEAYGSAILPPATLLAELTFRTATLLDANKTANPSSPYSASQLYELAYTRLLESNQPFAAASAAANRAALWAENKAYDQAIPWLQRALNLEEANEWPTEAAESHQRLAKAYAKTQQWQSALHHGDCVLRWLQSEEHQEKQAELLARWQQRLGQWAHQGGFPNQSKVYWLQALETLYGMSRVAPLTPQQQAQQNELETAIRQQA